MLRGAIDTESIYQVGSCHLESALTTFLKDEEMQTSRRWSTDVYGRRCFRKTKKMQNVSAGASREADLDVFKSEY